MSNQFVFKKYDHTIKEKIKFFLTNLKPTKEKKFAKYERFIEEPFLFCDESSLFEKLEKDIKYQVMIADEIIKFSETNPVDTKFVSYYWECCIEKERRIKFISINIHVEPENEKYGNMVFPIDIVKTNLREYKYWEIIHVDYALEAAKELIHNM